MTIRLKILSIRWSLWLAEMSLKYANVLSYFR